eukprot:SM000138S00066  [mRNA]  locus=s138:283819:286819:- [translate_table: standard]
MQAYRTALFLAYGPLNFSQQAYVKHAEKFREADVGHNLAGQHLIVTGGNAGIGKAGATVYLVCRSKERGEVAVADIVAKTGNKDVHLELCDLSSLQQVKDFACKYDTSGKPLHVLVNNAGIMELEKKQSAEGLELNFATNVMGVFAMTECLLPALQRAAPDAKVISVATGGILTEQLDLDLQMEHVKKFVGTQAYARNKRVQVPAGGCHPGAIRDIAGQLQVAVTEKWGELYKDKGVGFYSMHPGWVDTATLSQSMPGFYKTFKSRLRTPDQGADTVMWLAMQPNAALTQGGFYFDRAESFKHFSSAGTKYTKGDVDKLYLMLRSFAGLQSAAN